ncbi:hypothetical protein [Streptomonospora wellingtoniae]|uniref:XRE family transcriptional regulator n=1 Tax=Streptomonospora wellingtoniae TaxID=3075544 RepID=A0ABU2KUV3_9ACTN|nr:hypothetical protein [Streptomonospora sp. DSM 45055]MDT0302966.1 hypothetical protein [Streptomonospora sp. DSM 45055]
MSPTQQVWERLAELLVQQRGRIDSNARRFADSTRLNYRLIYDIEHARRTNFRPAKLAEIEHAYRLRAGAITDLLEGRAETLEPDSGTADFAGTAAEDSRGHIKGAPMLRPNEELRWEPQDPSLPGSPAIRYTYRWTSPEDPADYIESSKGMDPERDPLEVAKIFRDQLAKAYGGRILDTPEDARNP